jgi:DnaJ-class molecular chaperone
VATEDESTAGAAPEQPAEPVACSACRGTGQVVSNLGGHRSLVDCPWCDGGGVRLSDHDAQAHWRGENGASGDKAPASADRGPAVQPDDEPPGGQAA